MLSYFTKMDIQSQDEKAFYLKNGDIVNKSDCKQYANRFYPMARQYYKRDLYKQDAEVVAVFGELRHIPLKLGENKSSPIMTLDELKNLLEGMITYKLMELYEYSKKFEIVVKDFEINFDVMRDVVNVDVRNTISNECHQLALSKKDYKALIYSACGRKV